jgi:hypothetical protein
MSMQDDLGSGFRARRKLFHAIPAVIAGAQVRFQFVHIDR